VEAHKGWRAGSASGFRARLFRGRRRRLKHAGGAALGHAPLLKQASDARRSLQLAMVQNKKKNRPLRFKGGVEVRIAIRLASRPR